MSATVFKVKGTHTRLNGKPFLVKGLRCSNSLVSDKTAADLIDHLDLYAAYGLNTVSVYLMGSRYGDVKGYNEDASLNPVYTGRLARIINAADRRGMVVLVGCLYWGTSKAKWESWTQKEAARAVANTMRWLADCDYYNVFMDVDNEGMGTQYAGFDDRQLIIAAKEADADIPVAFNYKGPPPPEADLAIHHSPPIPGKPYIQSEGSPPSMPGGYWGPYSKNEEAGLYEYLKVGVYTEKMKADQTADTRKHLDHGQGYMFASTWLQAAPPQGPNHNPGGDGSEKDPGIKWWLEFIGQEY